MDVQYIVKQVFAVDSKVSDVCASLNALTLTLLQSSFLLPQKYRITIKTFWFFWVFNAASSTLFLSPIQHTTKNVVQLVLRFSRFTKMPESFWVKDTEVVKQQHSPTTGGQISLMGSEKLLTIIFPPSG